jgi:hypothetical protein
VLEDQYKKLIEYFRRHSAFVEIEMPTEMHTTAAHIISAPVILKIDFASRGRFSRFVSEIISLEDLYYEKYIREQNPTVARAYEEYQILLKLSL